MPIATEESLTAHMTSIANIRKEYRMATLDVANVAANPITQFTSWFEEALNAEVHEPNAMHLATVDQRGRPAGRIVLLKGVENGSFLFFTNYESRKGRELENNPGCALTFFWPEVERQVRIQGHVTRVSRARSLAYFQSRPRESQLGAWASPQSTAVVNRAFLLERLREVEARFQHETVLPLPDYWGGFEVSPDMIEFWQGGPGRMHDRIVYTLAGRGTWEIQRLAP